MTFQFVNFVYNFNTFIENLRNVYIYMYKMYVYIMLAIVNKCIFIYWIIFSSYNLWTSEELEETVYRRSIDMNINAYFYIVVLTSLKICFG
jgi:hypothetical protein